MEHTIEGVKSDNLAGAVDSKGLSVLGKGEVHFTVVSPVAQKPVDSQKGRGILVRANDLPGVGNHRGFTGAGARKIDRREHAIGVTQEGVGCPADLVLPDDLAGRVNSKGEALRSTGKIDCGERDAVKHKAMRHATDGVLPDDLAGRVNSIGQSPGGTGEIDGGEPVRGIQKEAMEDTAGQVISHDLVGSVDSTAAG